MDCSFRSHYGWSKSVFDHHCYSLAVSIPLAYFLLNDVKLRQFYYPLAMAAKAAIAIQLIESIMYLGMLPVNFQEEKVIYNCAEVVLSRINAMVILFGEMHLVYFLSKALGLGGQSIFLGRKLALNMSQALTLALFAAVCTVTACIFYRRVYGIVRDIWSVALPLLQFQQIKLARAKEDTDDCLIRPSDATVTIFGQLAMCQAYLGFLCLVHLCLSRLYDPLGMIQYTNARLVLDFVIGLFFYLKVLLVQNKADVAVELA